MILLKSRLASARKARGLAMVEFVIVLPVILLLAFGVTEVGRMLQRYNTLTKSLQDGVRHAAAYGALGTAGSVLIDAALDAEIRNLVVYGNAVGGGAPVLDGFDTSQISIQVTAPGLIEVSASYAYTPGLFSSLPTFGFGPSPTLAFTMQAAVTQRAL